MKFIWHLLLVVIIIFPFSVSAQEGEGQESKESGAVSAKFAAMNKEASVICGQYLPNQIPGMEEMMPLCGGRFGFKPWGKTFLEAQMLGGAARGQRYLLGTVSFRGDIQVEDIIGSFYGGGDIHYVTTPQYAATGAYGEETVIYFGAHVGGAIWWEFSDNLFLRTDLQFNLNPGTALFVGFGLVLRFGSGGGGGGAGDQ